MDEPETRPGTSPSRSGEGRLESPSLETLGQPVWIGPYRLTSRIATGGMAEVYVGRHISESGEFGPMMWRPT